MAMLITGGHHADTTRMTAARYYHQLLSGIGWTSLPHSARRLGGR